MLANSIRVWFKAARFPSQLYLIQSVLLGQALAYHSEKIWDFHITFFLLLYAVINQLFIVFANDVADYEWDRKNQDFTFLSGGSRVLVERIIPVESLSRAALHCAVLLLLLAAVFSIVTGKLFIFVFAVFSILLLLFYSFPPLNMSYRGHGEYLQALGLGFVLPYLGYYAQCGRLDFPWAVLFFTLPLQVAVAHCTAIPDYYADKIAHKKTFIVQWGLEKSMGVIGGLLGLSWLTRNHIVANGTKSMDLIWFNLFIVLVIVITSILIFRRKSRHASSKWSKGVLIFLALTPLIIAEVLHTAAFMELLGL